MKTVVVNVRNSDCDVRIGRNNKGEVPPVPEPGCFGNPFHVAEHGRDGAIAMYRDYFYKRISEDAEFREAILDLKGKILGCHCAPLPCHGNVIADWLDKQNG